MALPKPQEGKPARLVKKKKRKEEAKHEGDQRPFLNGCQWRRGIITMLNKLFLWGEKQLIII